MLKQDLFFLFPFTVYASHILSSGAERQKSYGVSLRRVHYVHMKTSTYKLQVSTYKKKWILFISSLPSTWFQATVAWSSKWGLRYYENGRLVAETNAVVEDENTKTDSYSYLTIGAASSNPTDTLLFSENIQISDLRIWETLLSSMQARKIYQFSGKLCFLHHFPIFIHYLNYI